MALSMCESGHEIQDDTSPGPCTSLYVPTGHAIGGKNDEGQIWRLKIDCKQNEPDFFNQISLGCP